MVKIYKFSRDTEDVDHLPNSQHSSHNYKENGKFSLYLTIVIAVIFLLYWVLTSDKSGFAKMFLIIMGVNVIGIITLISIFLAEQKRKYF